MYAYANGPCECNAKCHCYRNSLIHTYANTQCDINCNSNSYNHAHHDTNSYSDGHG